MTDIRYPEWHDLSPERQAMVDSIQKIETVFLEFLTANPMNVRNEHFLPIAESIKTRLKHGIELANLPSVPNERLWAGENIEDLDELVTSYIKLFNSYNKSEVK